LGPPVDYWTCPVVHTGMEKEHNLGQPMSYVLVTNSTLVGDLTARAGWQNFVESLSTNERVNRMIVETIAER